jgi:hypothetical protein
MERMSAAPIPKPGNELWGIYQYDSTTHDFWGDRVRMVVEAQSKEAAEEIAREKGLDQVWAWPLTSEQIQCLYPAQQTQPAQPVPNAPTAEQIHAAIEVLGKLIERIDDAASSALENMPKSQWAGQFAASLEVKTTEQTTSVKSIVAKLQNWQDELRQRAKQSRSYHV